MLIHKKTLFRSLFLTPLLLIGAGCNFGVDKTDMEFERAKMKTAYEAQQSALAEAQSEIDELKEESAATKQKQEDLEKRVQIGRQSTSISAAEIKPYLAGVVRLDCDEWWGTGSLWSRSGIGYSVLTNHHVIKDIGSTQYKRCLVLAESDANEDSYVDAALITSSSRMFLEEKNDSALIKLSSAQDIFNGVQTKPLNMFDYSVGSLKKCPTKMEIGSPLMVIGYPAFGVKEGQYEGSKFDQYSQISTNGIISGYDDSVNNPYWGELPFQNYYVSAKIDSGNSGGIAISKTSGGELCLLGVPTWVAIGNYETNGLIQNIHNIELP